MPKRFTVVCTDRGEHRRRRVTVIGDEPSFGFTRNATGVEIGTQRRGGAYWHCNTCNRTVELTEQRLQQLRDGLEAVGENQVDMSLIPGV